MIPLHNIQLNDVHNNLKRDNHQLKENVVNEVVDFNSIVTGDLRLLVKQPQQNNEVATVE